MPNLFEEISQQIRQQDEDNLKGTLQRVHENRGRKDLPGSENLQLAEKAPSQNPYKDMGLPMLEQEIFGGMKVGDLIPIISSMPEGQAPWEQLQETLSRDREGALDYASMPGEVLSALGIGPRIGKRAPSKRDINVNEKELSRYNQRVDELSKKYEERAMEEYLNDPSVDKITARRNVEGMLKNEINNMPDQGKSIDIGDLTPEEIAHLNRVSGEDYSKITGNKAIITPHQQAHQIYSRMLNFGKDTQMDADQFTSSLKKAVGGNTLTGKGPQDNNRGGILMANNNSRAFWKPEKGGADLRTFFPERANKDDLNRAPVAPPKAVSKNKKRNQKAEKRAKQEALLMAQKAGLR